MIRFLYNNLFDAGTCTDSSEASSIFVGTNVQNSLLPKTWRSTGIGAEFLKFDLGSATLIDTFTFCNNNLSATATVTLYGHATDLGTDLTVWASTATYSHTITNFNSAIGILSLSQTFQWWVLGISDSSNANGYIEIGRVFGGVSTQPSDNFNETFTESNFDPSELMWTQGQTLFSVPRNTYKQFAIDFNEMPSADLVLLRTIWSAVGKTQPFILSLDLENDPLNLSRYGVFTSDFNLSFGVNARANVSLVFRELR